MYTASDLEDKELERSKKFIAFKLRLLIEAFRSRAERVKEKVIQIPPTPSPPPERTTEDPERGARPGSTFLSLDHTSEDNEDGHHLRRLFCCQVRRRFLPKMPEVLDPQSKIYISWLFVVTLCFLYNSWGIFLRAIFPYQHPGNLPYLMAADYFCDVIYLLDMVLFKTRIQFLDSGFWVSDPVKTRKHYFKKLMFKMDALSLAPLDILYLKLGYNTLFRLPRLLKIQTFWEFFNRVDAVAKSPYIIRITRTLIYMMYLIHLNACAYYGISTWEGIASNTFVFAGIGNAYVRCLYFATKTATSTGKNPKPTNEYEYIFMTFSWLMGVFIFAFLIGQVRDIIANATQSNTQFRNLMDNTVEYMRRLNLPDDLQHRVRLWLNHTWESQKTLNESTILDALPKKMKTDIALQVHYDTLSKVQLFKDCDKALLQDLVLKIKPVLFLPGDYVCKKGQVGKEMYIVNKGLVEVKGGDDGSKVLATLSEGSVFGEISLLGIPGCDRRTADVQSKGFSNLFMLSKGDLWDALKVYPEAQSIMKKRAQAIINAQSKASNGDKVKGLDSSPIIVHPPRKTSTPKLFKTVIQAVPPESQCAKMLSNYTSKPLPSPSSKERRLFHPVKDIKSGNDHKAESGSEVDDSTLEELETGECEMIECLSPSKKTPTITAASKESKGVNNISRYVKGKTLLRRPKIAPMLTKEPENRHKLDTPPKRRGSNGEATSYWKSLRSKVHTKNCSFRVASTAAAESKSSNADTKSPLKEMGLGTRMEVTYNYEKTKTFSYKECIHGLKSPVEDQTAGNIADIDSTRRGHSFSSSKLNERVREEVKVTVENDSSKFDFHENLIRNIFARRKRNSSKSMQNASSLAHTKDQLNLNKNTAKSALIVDHSGENPSVPPVEDPVNWSHLKDDLKFQNVQDIGKSTGIQQSGSHFQRSKNDVLGNPQGWNSNQGSSHSVNVPPSPTLLRSSTSSSGLSLDGFDILGIVPSSVLEESSRPSSDFTDEL